MAGWLHSPLWLITVVYVTLILLEAVFERKRVAIETLEAPICICVPIGLIWLYVYILLDLARHDAFHFLETYNLTLGHERHIVFMKLFLFRIGNLTNSG